MLQSDIVAAILMFPIVYVYMGLPLFVIILNINKYITDPTKRVVISLTPNSLGYW